MTTPYYIKAIRELVYLGRYDIVNKPIITQIENKTMKFSELVRLLEKDGFRLAKEKGSIRYYSKSGWEKVIRIDYHGSKEVPTGTCQAILRAAGLKERKDKK